MPEGNRTMYKSLSAALIGAFLATNATAEDALVMEHRLGDIALSGAFSRATLPNAPVAGAFITIANEGADGDQLVSATSEIAGHIELHEMQMQDGVMRMRHLNNGIEIPAGETISLRPGGYHLMLKELRGALVEGETVMIELSFEMAGDIALPFIVGAINADTASPQDQDDQPGKN